MHISTKLLLAIAVVLGVVEFVHHEQIHRDAYASPLVPSQVEVIDGDTVRVDGVKFRLVGFDTAETWQARCSSELDLGDRATARLQQLINGGGVELQRIVGRGPKERAAAITVADAASCGFTARTSAKC